MIEKLNELANSVGLDTKEFQHQDVLIGCIKKIKNIDKFIEYCKRTKDQIRYETKAERLIKLQDKYIRIEMLRS